MSNNQKSNSWIKRFEVRDKYPVKESHLEKILHDHDLKFEVEKLNFFLVKGYEVEPSAQEFEEIIWDNTLQTGFGENWTLPEETAAVLQVQYLPGVTDNSAKALEETFALKGKTVECASGSLYFLLGKGDDAHKTFDLIKGEVGNSLIQDLRLFNPQDDDFKSRFLGPKLPEVKIHHQQTAKEVSLNLSDDELEKLSQEGCLALSLKEMKTIKDYYESKEISSQRKTLGLPQYPTDVELEVLAQTWSEHCKHKIFAADISYEDEQGNVEEIQSLYKSFIKKATKDIEANGVEWLVSVFSDNAGIVRFDEKIDLCIKAETHNSPSALDPYGGAITGILGVNRDILGCGLGARPIANTDVFCFASTELPEIVDPNKLPAGLMTPERLLKGVHKGVEDGGNKSGIPTVNGAIVFDKDFAGKPLVFCGTIGTLPATLPDGRPGSEKGAKIGDNIFVVGGAVGADGIHGATFSSMELGEESPATAVQIGDPLTQKRVMDFLLEARDLGLYTCVTDNGAGGISSSIGEMAELTNGARIELDLHPRKYPGLSPWEIMISESQERMTFAVAPSKCEAFMELAKSRGVEATNLGEFNNSGALEVFFKGERVAALEMKFLHEGVPTLKLKAKSQPLQARPSWIELPKINKASSLGEILKTILHSENIASKAPWVRQYDHEVQGATIGKPFPGKAGVSPGDSGVIDLEAHGGSEGSMVSVGCGIAPRLSAYSAKAMAMLSVDEAYRNVIVSGAQPDKVCLLDNFCWPDPVESPKNPDGPRKLGQLVDTCKGLYDICTLYRAPLVSGKDSMKNDFRGKNQAGEDLVISIQPTLLVTAMGYGNQKQLTRSVVTKEKTLLYRLGRFQGGLLVSELSEQFSSEVALKEGAGVSFNDWDFELCHKQYLAFHELTKKGLIQCAHDVSDGGLAVTLSEMLFDGNYGFETLGEGSWQSLPGLFGEGPGMIVVGIEPDNKEQFESFLNKAQIEFLLLGHSNNSGVCDFLKKETISTTELKESWQRDWGV